METEISLEMSEGRVLKVASVDTESRKVHARSGDMKIEIFTVTETADLPAVGDIIALTAQNYKKIPSELCAVGETSIGVVLKVLDDGRVLIHSNYNKKFIPKSEVKVKEGKYG